MNFLSHEVERASEVFQRTSFADAIRLLEPLLTSQDELTRVEATALHCRIQVERDVPEELEAIRKRGQELLAHAIRLKSPSALYQIGIAALLTEDSENANQAFEQCLKISTKSDRALAEYGIAAILNHAGQGEEALAVLVRLERADVSPDFAVLVGSLKCNVFLGLAKDAEAYSACLAAQSLLPHCTTFYLKNWVFFGLARVQARLGELTVAKTLFETVLALTHPVDFRRLNKLATDELSRLEMKVEVLLDSATGDVVSNRGYLCLRRKPTLIAMLNLLIQQSPNPISKEAMYGSVWKEGTYHPLRHDGLIYSHMQRLRQILKSDIGLGDFILTTPDGYRLNPNIRAKIKFDPKGELQ